MLDIGVGMRNVATATAACDLHVRKLFALQFALLFQRPNFLVFVALPIQRITRGRSHVAGPTAAYMDGIQLLPYSIFIGHIALCKLMVHLIIVSPQARTLPAPPRPDARRGRPRSGGGVPLASVLDSGFLGPR